MKLRVKVHLRTKMPLSADSWICLLRFMFFFFVVVVVRHQRRTKRGLNRLNLSFLLSSLLASARRCALSDYSVRRLAFFLASLQVPRGAVRRHRIDLHFNRSRLCHKQRFDSKVIST